MPKEIALLSWIGNVAINKDKDMEHFSLNEARCALGAGKE